MKSVIDEEKLSDFLDTTVEYKGKPVKVKELPTSELNKQVKLIQGVYEPEDWGDRADEAEPVKISEVNEETTVVHKVSPVCQVTEKLSGIIGDLNLLVKEFDKIDDVVIIESSDSELLELKASTISFISSFEAIYLKVQDLKERVR